MIVTLPSPFFTHEWISLAGPAAVAAAAHARLATIATMTTVGATNKRRINMPR